MDKEHYFKYFLMPPEIFDHLLNFLKQTLEHVPRHRYPITAAERLAITLRILATGDSQQTVAFSYRLGKSTVNASSGARGGNVPGFPPPPKPKKICKVWKTVHATASNENR